MQKIALEKAAEGMVLAKPIVRENGLVLMGEGTELNEQLIERLKGLDITKVTVKGRPLGGEDGKSVEVLIAELEERFAPVLSDKLCVQIKDIINKDIKRRREEAEL
jgi:hypothetical protein